MVASCTAVIYQHKLLHRRIGITQTKYVDENLPICSHFVGSRDSTRPWFSSAVVELAYGTQHVATRTLHLSVYPTVLSLRSDFSRSMVLDFSRIQDRRTATGLKCW